MICITIENDFSSNSLFTTIHLIVPTVCSLLHHQSVSAEEEERERQQESRWRGLGKLRGTAERPGRNSGLVSRAED